MTEEKKEIKIEFAPGCFDGFEGTQEELDELISEIKNMIQTGEFEVNSREITEADFDELPEEVQQQIARSFGDETPNRTLN